VAGAVGLVAGTDDDTMNLGLVTMARRVNPSIAVVVRQHKAYNRVLIEAARARLTFVQSDLMTHEVLQALTTPLLNRFLELARRDGAALARQALQRLDASFGRQVPFVWTFECDPSQPGIRQARKLAELPFWREVQIICSSWEPKALQTAQIVAEQHSLPIEPVFDLRELRRTEGVVADYEAAIHAVLFLTASPFEICSRPSII